MDDFSVKYVGQENSEHLYWILEETRLERGICWSCPGLGLQWQGSIPFHTRVYTKSIKEIPSPTIRKTSASIIFSWDPKRAERTIWNDKKHHTATWPITNKIYMGGHRDIHIFFPSSQQHNANYLQCHHVKPQWYCNRQNNFLIKLQQTAKQQLYSMWVIW